MKAKKPTVDKGALARLLRELRLKAGLSQEELAHRAGLTKQRIYQLERGGTGTRVETAERLAAALDVPASVFVSDNGQSDKLDPLVAREIAKLPPDIQRTLLLELYPIIDQMAAKIAEEKGKYETED